MIYEFLFVIYATMDNRQRPVFVIVFVKLSSLNFHHSFFPVTLLYIPMYFMATLFSP